VQELMRTRVAGRPEPTVDARFCLMFPREALSVPVMRRVLGDTLNTLGVDDSCIADLLLAVTEACTNVLRHSGPGLRYEVVAQVGRNRCVLEVLDSGRGFDPATVPTYRPGTRPISRLRRRFAPTSASSGPAPTAPSVVRGRLARVRRAAENRALARLPESGRGLAIMQACVDDVTLSSCPGRGTVVSLHKRIELRSDAPLSRADNFQLRDAG
jgi:serine/threonine-protein kinase RsbW